MADLVIDVYNLLRLLPDVATGRRVLAVAFEAAFLRNVRDVGPMEDWAFATAERINGHYGTNVQPLIDALAEAFANHPDSLAVLRQVAGRHGLRVVPPPRVAPPARENHPRTQRPLHTLTLTFGKGRLTAHRSDRPGLHAPVCDLPEHLPLELVRALDTFEKGQAHDLSNVALHGAVLGDALRIALASQAGEARSGWAAVDDCLAGIDPNEADLAIRLHFTDPQSPWSFLPWELVRLHPTGELLVSLSHVHLYRRLSTPIPVRTREAGGPDRLVLLQGGPDAKDGDAAEVRGMLDRASARIVSAWEGGGGEVHPEPRPEPAQDHAVDVLRATPHRVLCLLGHGLGSEFQLSAGRRVFVSTFAQALTPPAVPEAVLLAACRSGVGNADLATAWAAAVSPFLARGVPEVLGFSQSVSLRDASRATAAWCAALLAGKSPLEATRAARQEIAGYESLGLGLLTHWRGPAADEAPLGA